VILLLLLLLLLRGSRAAVTARMLDRAYCRCRRCTRRGHTEYGRAHGRPGSASHCGWGNCSTTWNRWMRSYGPRLRVGDMSCRSTTHPGAGIHVLTLPVPLLLRQAIVAFEVAQMLGKAGVLIVVLEEYAISHHPHCHGNCCCCNAHVQAEVSAPV